MSFRGWVEGWQISIGELQELSGVLWRIGSLSVVDGFLRYQPSWTTSHQAKASLLGLGSTAAADARHWEASLALAEAGLHIFAATPLLSLLPLSLSLSS